MSHCNYAPLTAYVTRANNVPHVCTEFLKNYEDNRVQYEACDSKGWIFQKAETRIVCDLLGKIFIT